MSRTPLSIHTLECGRLFLQARSNDVTRAAGSGLQWVLGKSRRTVTVLLEINIGTRVRESGRGMEILLRFLGWRLRLTLDVAVNVGLVVHLFQDILRLSPSRADGRRDVLTVRQSVTTGSDMANHALNKCALADAGAQESGVQGENDPAAAGEEDGRTHKAEPQRKLEAGNERHAGVIVVLDEAADGVGHAGSLGFLTRRSRWRGADSGKKNAAGVGQDVEDAVDSVWKESKRILARKEPEKGHCWIS